MRYRQICAVMLFSPSARSKPCTGQSRPHCRCRPEAPCRSAGFPEPLLIEARGQGRACGSPYGQTGHTARFPRCCGSGRYSPQLRRPRSPAERGKFPAQPARVRPSNSGRRCAAPDTAPGTPDGRARCAHPAHTGQSAAGRASAAPVRILPPALRVPFAKAGCAGYRQSPPDSRGKPISDAQAARHRPPRFGKVQPEAPDTSRPPAPAAQTRL